MMNFSHEEQGFVADLQVASNAQGSFETINHQITLPFTFFVVAHSTAVASIASFQALFQGQRCNGLENLKHSKQVSQIRQRLMTNEHAQSHAILQKTLPNALSTKIRPSILAILCLSILRSLPSCRKKLYRRTGQYPRYQKLTTMRQWL